MDVRDLPNGENECSMCGDVTDVRCRDCANEWDAARLAPQVLATLAVVEDLVASASEERRPALEKARLRARDLAVEVGRALAAGAFDVEHVALRVVELGSALAQEINRRRERELVAVKGGEKVALRAALMHYGEHMESCPRRSRPAAGQCTCGWSEIAQEIGAGF